MGWRAPGRRARSAAGLLGAASCLLAAITSTCTDLRRPTTGECGNRIYEPDRREDCDANTTEDGKFACGEPGQGPAVACHWLCDSDGQCPEGFRCDSQGQVCHQPTQAFVETVSNLALSPEGVPTFTRVRDLRVAELDAAPPRELVVLGGDAVATESDGVFVSSFDDEARALDVRRERSGLKAGVPLAVSDAADDDGVVFVATHPRLASVLPLRGRSSGSLLPGLAGQWGGLSHRALLSPGVKNNETGTFGFTLVVDAARSALAVDALVTGPLPGYLVEAPHLEHVELHLDPTDEVLGRMATGSLIPDGPSVLAMGLRKPLGVGGGSIESEVRVYAVLEGVTFGFASVVLPRGVQLASGGGVWLGPVDDDAFSDLMFAAQDGNTYVAYSLGDGVSFAPVSANPLIVGAHPLAVGLIDGDARVDFVFPDDGIALSQPDEVATVGTTCPTIQSSATYACGLHNGLLDAGELPRWKDARLGDVNGDGRVDVVAAGDAAVLDVFLTDYATPSSGALLLRRSTPTAGAPRHLSIADLDADLVQDIAFSVDAPTDGAPESLYVAFGTRSGQSEAPVKLLDADRFLDVDVVSSENQIFLLTEDGGEEARWSLLLPRADRELSSPLLVPCLVGLSTTDPDALVVPQQLAAGRFGGEHVDAALLYRDCFSPQNSTPADRLVLVPATPNGGLASVFSEALDPNECLGGNFVSCQQARRAFRPTGLDLDVPAGWSSTALLRAIDLDGDGTDELVVWGPDGSGSRVVVLRSDGAPKPRFEVLEDDALDVPVGGSYSGPRGELRLADVDGDDRPDLVALTTPSEGEARSLVVLRNDGVGGLRVSEPLRFDLTPWAGVRAFALLDARTRAPAPVGQGPDAVASLEPLDGVDDDVLLAADDGIHLCHLDVTREAVDCDADLPTSMTGDHLVAADFDGDNLTDFAFSSDDGAVHVFRSVAENP